MKYFIKTYLFSFQSGGDLENAEHTANIISELVSLADKVPPHKEGYKKLTGIPFKNSNLQ